MECDRPIGIWLSVIANGIAIAGGAVFLVAAPGARFRGMEPEAQLFVFLLFIAAAFGLFIALPISLADVIRRHRLWGVVGAIGALSPLPMALLVLECVGYLLDLQFD